MLNYSKYLLLEKKKNNNTVKISETDLFDFIYSKDFGDTIRVFKQNPIVNDIILSYDKIKTKYTYIDITEEDDIISYMDATLAKTLDDNDDIWNHHDRKRMKIGRLINKIFPESNNENLERFVNQYKSVIRENKTFFKVLNGDNIVYYYSEDNTKQAGTLGKSCMKYDRCKEYLDLYKNNPEKISLLILFDKTNPDAIGRALLWKLDSHNCILMDKIYTANDSDKNLFKRYAMDNGIFLTKHDDVDNGLKGFYSILKPKKYKYYPYLDTLYIYQPSNGIITDTIKNVDTNEEVYILDDTFGFYRYYKS